MAVNKRFHYVLASLMLVASITSCKHHKVISRNDTTVNDTTNNNTESATSVAIKEKYAIQLGVDSKNIDNVKLYKFIDEWYGVPYKYSGCDKQGVDCSCLASNLYSSVYNKQISRASKDIYASCEEIDISQLQEGDFVFFKIESKNVSHVGVYLMNNKFVHATTKRGVMINDLNEAYYKKYFYKGGRLK